MNTEARQYKDVAGNPVTLDWLVRNEPEWAANQIRHRDKLQADFDKQVSVTICQMQTIRELRGQYKRLHSQVAGYLHGEQWEHWMKYNEPNYAPAESANNA